MKVKPPVLGDKANFYAGSEFIQAARLLEIKGQFVGDSERQVPIEVEDRTMADFRRDRL